jgi:hypothetical protein
LEVFSLNSSSSIAYSLTKVTASFLTYHLDSLTISAIALKSTNPEVSPSSPLFDSADLSQKALKDDFTSASNGCNKK